LGRGRSISGISLSWSRPSGRAASTADNGRWHDSGGNWDQVLDVAPEVPR
jgi:hypothetical protein